MATPEKKKPAVTKTKKAAAVSSSSENESSEEQPQQVVKELKSAETKPAQPTEARKRPKAVKEVVAAKKPKSTQFLIDTTMR